MDNDLAHAAVVVVPGVAVLVLRAVELGKRGLVRLGLEVEEDRLGDEHPRRADKEHEEQERLNLGLALEHFVLLRERAGLEEHVNNDREDQRGVVEVADPLEHDEEAHVAEEREKEQHLRNELAEDRDVVAELEVVGE
eukprot:Amastigsp_a508691_358.p5 type:complete len:138 gc:universal Amastigsp_a508691_358:2109-1696(-)